MNRFYKRVCLFIAVLMCLAAPVHGGKADDRHEVTAVYPTSDVLPENLLRLYVHFSTPMRRGQVRESIKLIGENGEQIINPFLNLAIELWDRDERRLTLLLDPGRIKRGVGPNVQAGAPLQRGKRYTLVISQDMNDYRGKPLDRTFTKSFIIQAPIRSALLPGKWITDLPKAKSQEPLILEFSRIMDRPLLFRFLAVLDADGQAVKGNIVVVGHETRWEFIPSAQWQSGLYRLAISTDLEDVAGNNVRAAFDVAVDETIMNEKNVEQVFLPFYPKH